MGAGVWLIRRSDGEFYAGTAERRPRRAGKVHACLFRRRTDAEVRCSGLRKGGADVDVVIAGLA